MALTVDTLKLHHDTLLSHSKTMNAKVFIFFNLYTKRSKQKLYNIDAW